MKRALVTALMCLLSLYIGSVLLMSWDLYNPSDDTNAFVKSFWGLLNMLHVMCGIVLMFAPFGIIPYRHK